MRLLSQKQLKLESVVVAARLKADRLRRLPGAVAATFVALLMNQVAFAVIFCLFNIAFELLGDRILARPGENPTQLSFRRAFCTLICNALALAGFMAPPFLFASDDSTALLIAGMLWMASVLFYIAQSFGNTPLYNWVLVAVSGVGITIFIALHVAGPTVASTTLEQCVAFGILVLALCVWSETVRQHILSTGELARARDVAKSQLREMESLSKQDFLTGLMTRAAFEDILESMLSTGKQACVLLIDLDGFKPINDSYSHAAGDAVLCAVARRLMRNTQPFDAIGRLGGDEFAVAVNRQLSKSKAKAFAQDLANALSEPVQFEQRILTISASIGIAQATDDCSLRQIMTHADQAMYAAKGVQGPSQVFHDPKEFRTRATLDDRAMLFEALENDEITPFYQPKIDLETGETVGIEALARWVHPSRGLVMPGEFLPVIAELGMQGDFLMYTLNRTLEHVRILVEDGIDPGFVSVNLPEVTLATSTGRDTLLDLLRKHPLSLPYLTFEVTEDIFIARSASIIQHSIQQFRRMGVRISLDDFGTGFASFAHLRELEFDELKLDTAFVQGLGTETAAEVLIKAFLDIGLGLQVDTIAEGVETQEQCDILRQMGCQCAQGFLFSKAVPFAQIKTRLEIEKSARASDVA